MSTIINGLDLEMIKKAGSAISMESFLEKVSHNIFHILRELDKTNYDLVKLKVLRKWDLGLLL